MGVVCAVEHIFNETAMHEKAQATNRMTMVNRASHGPRVSPHSQAQARVKKTGISKGKFKKEPKVRTEVPKAHTRANIKAGLSSLENSKSEASSLNDGWNGDEWNDGWEQTYDTSASSFSLGGLDVSATNSPKRLEWVKMNLDTGVAVNPFPLNFGPERAFYRTASGEWILDGGTC